MARHLTRATWLFPLCLLLLLPTTTRAQSAHPSEAEAAFPAAEYRARAMKALDSGNPQLAGQILMLSYQDHGDTEALYIAGMVFRSAGDTQRAWQVWSVFLCNSHDGDKRREVRRALHSMLPSQPPKPCSNPPGTAAPPTHPEPRTERYRPPHYDERSRYSRASVERRSLGSARDTKHKFELEAGMSAGDEAFALTWGPGLWLGNRRDTRFGFFTPIMLGEKLGSNASIGLEPRLRHPLNEDVSAEFAAGIHTGDRGRYSIGAALNFSEVISLGVSYESLTDEKYDEYSDNTWGTFVNLTLTGKAGKTTTAVEGGLSMLILALLIGG